MVAQKLEQRRLNALTKQEERLQKQIAALEAEVAEFVSCTLEFRDRQVCSCAIGFVQEGH